MPIKLVYSVGCSLVLCPSTVASVRQ